MNENQSRNRRGFQPCSDTSRYMTMVPERQLRTVEDALASAQTIQCAFMSWQLGGGIY